MFTILILCHEMFQAGMRARRILDTAILEKRAMTLMEQLEFDALMARCHELEQQIEARNELRKV